MTLALTRRQSAVPVPFMGTMEGERGDDNHASTFL